MTSKRAKKAVAQKNKQIHTAINPNSSLHQHPAWHFSRRDMDHPEWGWNTISGEDFHELISQHLACFETMTWSQILEVSGGKSKGTHHHSINIHQCSKDAQRRLAELKLDNIPALFSLRINNKKRIWGIKEGHVLRLLWIDKQHSVYPSHD